MVLPYKSSIIKEIKEKDQEVARIIKITFILTAIFLLHLVSLPFYSLTFLQMKLPLENSAVKIKSLVLSFVLVNLTRQCGRLQGPVVWSNGSLTVAVKILWT